MAQLGNLQQEIKLHTFLKNNKAKEKSRRLRFLRPNKKGAGVLWLTVESENTNKEVTSELMEVWQTVKLENVSMREIEQQSRI